MVAKFFKLTLLDASGSVEREPSTLDSYREPLSFKAWNSGPLRKRRVKKSYLNFEKQERGRNKRCYRMCVCVSFCCVKAGESSSFRLRNALSRLCFSPARTFYFPLSRLVNYI